MEEYPSEIPSLAALHAAKVAAAAEEVAAAKASALAKAKAEVADEVAALCGDLESAVTCEEVADIRRRLTGKTVASTAATAQTARKSSPPAPAPSTKEALEVLRQHLSGSQIEALERLESGEDLVFELQQLENQVGALTQERDALKGELETARKPSSTTAPEEVPEEEAIRKQPPAPTSEETAWKPSPAAPAAEERRRPARRHKGLLERAGFTS